MNDNDKHGHPPVAASSTNLYDLQLSVRRKLADEGRRQHEANRERTPACGPAGQTFDPDATLVNPLTNPAHDLSRLFADAPEPKLNRAERRKQDAIKRMTRYAIEQEKFERECARGAADSLMYAAVDAGKVDGEDAMKVLKWREERDRRRRARELRKIPNPPKGSRLNTRMAAELSLVYRGEEE